MMTGVARRGAHLLLIGARAEDDRQADEANLAEALEDFKPRALELVACSQLPQRRRHLLDRVAHLLLLPLNVKLLLFEQPGDVLLLVHLHYSG